jgi:hypothetical protein
MPVGREVEAAMGGCGKEESPPEWALAHHQEVFMNDDRPRCPLVALEQPRSDWTCH